MVSLLKTFGKGFLYVIGLPFFILALAIFAVIGVFLFVFQIVRSIIFFFTGQKFFPELEEDKKLRLMKEKASGEFDKNDNENKTNENESLDSNRSSIIFPYDEEEDLEKTSKEESPSVCPSEDVILMTDLDFFSLIFSFSVPFSFEIVPLLNVSVPILNAPVPFLNTKPLEIRRSKT